MHFHANVNEHSHIHASLITTHHINTWAKHTNPNFIHIKTGFANMSTIYIFFIVIRLEIVTSWHPRVTLA